MKTSLPHLIFGLLLSHASSTADPGQQTVVVPNASENFDKPQPNGAQMIFGGNDRRIIIIDSAQLAGQMPEGGLITGFAMRLDAEAGSAINGHVPEVQIHFGIANSLEPVFTSSFESLIGSRYELVFPVATVPMNVPFTPGTVQPFELEFPLTTWFRYHPGEGNLLIDMSNFDRFQGGNSPRVDNAANSSVRQYSMSIIPVVIRGSGPALELQFIPIPEPGRVSLFSIGFLFLACIGRYRKQ